MPFGGETAAVDGPGVDAESVGDVEAGVVLEGEAPIGMFGSASCFISCITPVEANVIFICHIPLHYLILNWLIEVIFTSGC